MGWFITVDFVDDRESLAAHIDTPSVGPAVESALHKMQISQERIGSYQITVTNDSMIPHHTYSRLADRV